MSDCLFCRVVNTLFKKNSGTSKAKKQMTQLKPEHSIVPIVRCTKAPDIIEILGTGFLAGKGDNMHVITAKHIFENCPLKKGEKYGYVFKRTRRIELYSISKIIGDEEYDIAVFKPAYISEAVPLAFSEQQPALNEDVFCYEYSNTRIEITEGNRKHVSFEPMAHKGNIMRYYVSDYPEKKKTPCFIVSFPALQGASGSPVLAGTKKKNFYTTGMIVANWQRHLLPAQVVKIQEGDKYMEETSYFLPLGKAISATLIVPFLKGLNIDVEMVE